MSGAEQGRETTRLDFVGFLPLVFQNPCAGLQVIQGKMTFADHACPQFIAEVRVRNTD